MPFALGTYLASKFSTDSSKTLNKRKDNSATVPKNSSQVNVTNHRMTSSPPLKTWLAPPYVAKIPTYYWASTADTPAASSTKSVLNATYFPETDTYYIPATAHTRTLGGSSPSAYEVCVANYDNPTERHSFPEEFWAFRDSALEELMTTGRCHWRPTDRWGRLWEEGRWEIGDLWPVWNDRLRVWDHSDIRRRG